MGFPTYAELARAMGVAPVTFDDMREARVFMGNAMHGAVAGVVPPLVTVNLSFCLPLAVATMAVYSVHTYVFT